MLDDDDFRPQHAARELALDRLADVGEAIVASIQDLAGVVANLSGAVSALQNQPDTTRLSSADQAEIDGAVASLQSAADALNALANPAPADVGASAEAPGGTSPDQPQVV